MKKILFVLTAVFALSCTSDNEVTDKAALKLVTGVRFRQTFDDTPFQLGNPNTFVNNKFVVYPNPAHDNVFVSTDETITDVWIVPANAQKIHQDVNFGSILDSTLYTEQTISTNADFSVTGQSASDINLDISTLQQGYYRIFVKIGGAIYWDNLYRYDDGWNEDEFNALVEFWD